MFLASLLLFSAVGAYAQTGIHLNYMHSWERDKISGSKQSSPELNGFAVGVDYEINILKGLLAFQPGLSYYHLADEESSFSYSSYRVTQSHLQNYLAMPLHLKVKFGIGGMKIFVFAGPTITMGLQDRDKFSADGLGSVSYNAYNGKIKASSTSAAGLLDGYVPDDEQEDRFDMLFGGGVGLELLSILEVKAGIDWGLTNRYCDTYSADDYSNHRRQFYIGVGLRF